MEMKEAIGALSALAQEHRLAVFRFVIAQGPNGLPAGAIADGIGVPPSTLSHHLAHLVRARLLRSWRRERHVFYAVDVDGMRRLIAFLTEDCCAGRPEICGWGPAAGDDSGEEESMADRPYNVLFLCTGNSARSILAESILNRAGAGRFVAYSAGSMPTGRVNPYALDLLRLQNYPTGALRSKSWSEFAEPGAPPLDFVFTVCDNAASEVCPVWPGQPMTAHWGLPDPAAVEGSEAVKRAAFADTMRMLHNRIGVLISLPLASLDRLALQERLDAIGRTREAAATPAG
jgi:ArsR family transcriptional regulator, arsenate/arsenite/antimonite-responsive transcriptional repressor / arsenate reductase (thioredoxin)